MAKPAPRTALQQAGEGTLLLEPDGSQFAPSAWAAGDEVASTDAAAFPKANVKCSGCDHPIAYQPPIPGEPVGIWLCQTCGAVYYGDDAEEAAAHAFGVVRAAGSQTNPYIGNVSAALDARIGSVPPEYVQRLVRALTSSAHEGPDRRQTKRYRMAVPVVAVPLGFDFKVAGDPLRMTTKDISVGGVSLIHTRFTERPYFALDFTAAGVEHMQVTLEVLSVKNFGPVYEIAGKFVDRTARKPTGSTKQQAQ
jgi:ribosomal protein L37AE/L43A